MSFSPDSSVLFDFFIGLIVLLPWVISIYFLLWLLRAPLDTILQAIRKYSPKAKGSKKGVKSTIVILALFFSAGPVLIIGAIIIVAVRFKKLPKSEQERYIKQYAPGGKKFTKKFTDESEGLKKELATENVLPKKEVFQQKKQYSSASLQNKNYNPGVSSTGTGSKMIFIIILIVISIGLYLYLEQRNKVFIEPDQSPSTSYHQSDFPRHLQFL